MSDKKDSLKEFREREAEKKKKLEKEKEELEKRKHEANNKMSVHVAKAGFMSKACNAYKSYNPGLANDKKFQKMEKNLSNSVWNKYGR